MESINKEELIEEAMRYCLSQLPGANEIMKIKKENETLKKSNANLCKTINEIKTDLESTQKEFEGYRQSVKAMYKNSKNNSD